ncbi:ParA family protein, partial [Parasphingorhabdus sp.]|uniref:ParA family protein n=1 Tax=Parasphingorhabdus sp. TaxID=2709688 RepID=UPI0030AD1592
ISHQKSSPLGRQSTKSAVLLAALSAKCQLHVRIAIVRGGLKEMSKDYDRIILDCPPGLTETSEQILRNADIVIVPVIPSPLSERALTNVQMFLDSSGKKHAPLLPVYTMVDRRRSIHKQGLIRKPKWPVIPMSSAVEHMTSLQQPVGSFAPRSPAGQAYAHIWRGIEKRLAKK